MRTKTLILVSIALLMSLNLFGCVQANSSSTSSFSLQNSNSSSDNTSSVTSLVTSNPSSFVSSTPITSGPVTSTPTIDVPPEVPPQYVDETPYDFELRLPDELPRIDIKTSDGSNSFATDYSREDKINGLINYVDSKVSVSNCDEDYELADIDCQVKVRGNYTLYYEKKPIRLKFNKKQKMLGLNDDQKFKSWVLLADWKDCSMLKNQLSFYLGNQLLGSDGLYCSDFQYVHVYINNNYWGMYLLCEQQQTNAGRFDLTEPEDDYTGTDIGYLFEYDSYYIHEDIEKGGDYTFTVDYANNGIVYQQNGYTNSAENNGYTIKNDIYSQDQVDFIKNYVENVYKIVYSAIHLNELWEFTEDGNSVVKVENPTSISKESICRKYLDIDSFVDMFLYSEIVRDTDISFSSFYLSADFGPTGNKKITLHGPWDKDNAFGGKAAQTMYDDRFAGNSRNPWLTLLAKAVWFQSLVSEKYQDAKKHGVFNKSLRYVADFSNKYVDDFARNFERWPHQMGNPTGELDSAFNDHKTQKDASDYLYGWLQNRYNYLDGVYSYDTAFKFKD